MTAQPYARLQLYSAAIVRETISLRQSSFSREPPLDPQAVRG